MTRRELLKGKKFRYSGRDERGSHVLTECVREEEAIVVTVDDVRPGEPLRLGEELCQVEQGDDGQLEVDFLDTGAGGGEGPPMVSTNAYRNGWERAFKSKSKSN